MALQEIEKIEAAIEEATRVDAALVALGMPMGPFALTDMIGLGAPVTRGQPLCTLHAATEEAAGEAARAVRAAITIGDAAVPGPLVLERIG